MCSVPNSPLPPPAPPPHTYTVPEERKRLKLKDPERYHWRPRELIVQLAQIHINLYRADAGQWVQAVAADTDYYGKKEAAEWAGGKGGNLLLGCKWAQIIAMGRGLGSPGYVQWGMAVPASCLLSLHG